MTTATKPAAYATLLTRASYLPGVITLAFTLAKQSSAYPLLVLVTHGLSSSALQALELESRLNPLIQIRRVSPLLPEAHQRSGQDPITPRFADTWTKLRVFELTDFGAIAYLDADTVVRANVDELFDWPLPGPDWLAATAACVCNLDGDGWAPADWTPANCGYSRSEANRGRLAPPPLNSGVFVFRPSPALRNEVLRRFRASTRLREYKCPDQDFMAEEAFRDRWVPLPWCFNALKTMRQWHANLWTREAGDSEVKVLHYIVDKPWEKRVASDGLGGHLGRDGTTHSWWWSIWEEWQGERKGSEDGQTVVDLVAREGLVAEALSVEQDRAQVLQNKESGLPVEIPLLDGMNGAAVGGIRRANYENQQLTATCT